MTTDEIQQATRDLLGEGYTMIESWDLFEPGTRVYHTQQVYFEARQFGTATILAVFEKDPSAWAQKYKRPDIEVIVQRDKDQTIGRWADYHMDVALVQERV